MSFAAAGVRDFEVRLYSFDESEYLNITDGIGPSSYSNEGQSGDERNPTNLRIGCEIASFEQLPHYECQLSLYPVIGVPLDPFSTEIEGERWFDYQRKVEFWFTDSTNTLQKCYTLRIRDIKYYPPDEGQFNDSGGPERLDLGLVDILRMLDDIEPDQDTSGVELGGSGTLGTVINNTLAIKNPNLQVVVDLPKIANQVSTPLPYTPRGGVGVIKRLHQLIWANSPSGEQQFLYIDPEEEVRVGSYLYAAPTSELDVFASVDEFGLTGTKAMKSPRIPDPVERPVKLIRITGTGKRAIPIPQYLFRVYDTYGESAVFPATRTTYRWENNYTTQPFTTVTDTKVEKQLQAVNAYVWGPDGPQSADARTLGFAEQTVITKTFDNQHRIISLSERTIASESTLLMGVVTAHGQEDKQESDNLTRYANRPGSNLNIAFGASILAADGATSLAPGLSRTRFGIDKNTTPALDTQYNLASRSSQLGRVKTTSYVYGSDGLVDSIVTTERGASGLVGGEEENPFFMLTVKIMRESWVRLYNGEYAYVPSTAHPDRTEEGNQQRFTGAQVPQDGTDVARPEPPEYQTPLYEYEDYEISCDRIANWGTYLVFDSERTFSYGDALISNVYCESAIDNIIHWIYGWQRAREIRLPITDGMIEAQFRPSLKVDLALSGTNIEYHQLVGHEVVIDDGGLMYLEGTGIWSGERQLDGTATNPAQIQYLVRTTSSGGLRVTSDGGLRVVGAIG